MSHWVKIFFLLTLCLSLPLPVTALSPGDLVINEIMKDPDAVSDTNGEWFEIYNNTNQAIDLRDLTFKDSGTNQFLVAGSEPVFVEAFGFFVFGRNQDPAINGGVAVGYEYSNFPLANDDDEIIILEGTTEIDRAEYDDGVNWPDPTGASMMLLTLNLDNNIGVNWATASADLVYGDGDFGTPGEANYPTSTPTPTNTPTPTSTPTPDTPTATPTEAESLPTVGAPTPTSFPRPVFPLVPRFPRRIFRYLIQRFARFCLFCP